MTRSESNKIYVQLQGIDRLQYSLLNAIRSNSSVTKINKAYENLQDMMFRLKQEYKRP